MSWRTRTAIALGVFAAVGLSAAAIRAAYELGGRVGYLDGYLAASLDHEMNNGAVTVSALRSIRGGDLAAATGLLETSVDSAVLVYSGSADVDLSRFEPRERSQIRTDRVFSSIAKYRRTHPSTSPYESVRETIASTVARAPEIVSICKGPALEQPSSASVQAADSEREPGARR